MADSACSATAYLTGVKANYATLGVTAAVQLGDCMAENNTANHVDSIIAWAQAQGKATGECPKLVIKALRFHPWELPCSLQTVNKTTLLCNSNNNSAEQQPSFPSLTLFAVTSSSSSQDSYFVVIMTLHITDLI